MQFGRLRGLIGGLPQPLGEGRIVAGESRLARLDRYRIGKRAHFGGVRGAKLIAAVGDIAGAATDVGGLCIEALLSLLDRAAIRHDRDLAELLDIGLDRFKPVAGDAVPERGDLIAYAAPSIVEGT